jgi:hypothetical protein
MKSIGSSLCVARMIFSYWCWKLIKWIYFDLMSKVKCSSVKQQVIHFIVNFCVACFLCYNTVSFMQFAACVSYPQTTSSTTAARSRPKSEDYQHRSLSEDDDKQSIAEVIPAAKDHLMAQRPLKQQHEAQSTPSLSGS